MATGAELEKSESVPTGLKSKAAVGKLDGSLLASGNGMASYSTSSISNSGYVTSDAKGDEDGISRVKGDAAKDPVGERGIYSTPTSSYNYYYPGYSGPFTQLGDHGYFQPEGSHVGIHSDNGSVVYYLPGYNPYASGAVVGVDGQSVTQQPYFSSSGFPEISVSYGSEAMPCYSWDSTYFGNVSNGNAGSGNGKYGSIKSNGLSSTKFNGGIGGKSSKSTHTQPTRPFNKASPLDSDFSAGFFKGYQPVGSITSFSVHKQAPFSRNGPMNYRQNGRVWNENDRNKSRDKFYKPSDFETSTELTCGPRASFKTALLDSSVKNNLGFSLCRDQYNQPNFGTEYRNAKFYVIKSYNEDDIHKSVKYGVWASTPNGNKKLDAAFCEAEQQSSETGTNCPVFLFFSVNGSGQFVGIAEMVGRVDFDKDMDFWQLDKWSGFFPVKWHVVKDVPNNQLWHIILENNDRRSVTFSRDTQEVGLKQGLEMLNIFKKYSAKSSLLDDFDFYENREQNLVKKGRRPATLRMEMHQNGEFPKHAKAGDRKQEDESSWVKKTTNPSSLINLTSNLSLNGYSGTRSNSPKKLITDNSVVAFPAP